MRTTCGGVSGIELTHGGTVDATGTNSISTGAGTALNVTNTNIGTAGLIFDCDGTLADTMPAHYKAWTAMLDRFGIPFPEPRFYAMGGMPTGTIIRVLAAEVGIPLFTNCLLLLSGA